MLVVLFNFAKHMLSFVIGIVLAEGLIEIHSNLKFDICGHNDQEIDAKYKLAFKFTDAIMTCNNKPPNFTIAIGFSDTIITCNK